MFLPGPKYTKGQLAAFQDMTVYPLAQVQSFASNIVDAEGWTWYASGYWNTVNKGA